jgi:hypothetical protein
LALRERTLCWALGNPVHCPAVTADQQGDYALPPGRWETVMGEVRGAEWKDQDSNPGPCGLKSDLCLIPYAQGVVAFSSRVKQSRPGHSTDSLHDLRKSLAISVPQFPSP